MEIFTFIFYVFFFTHFWLKQVETINSFSVDIYSFLWLKQVEIVNSFSVDIHSFLLFLLFGRWGAYVFLLQMGTREVPWEEIQRKVECVISHILLLI